MSISGGSGGSSSGGTVSVPTFSNVRNLDPGQAFVRGFVAWILSVWGSVIASTRIVFDFLILPLDVLGDIVGTIAARFFLVPTGIIPDAAAITSRSLLQFGTFALPASVGIGLLSISLVVWYLQSDFTGQFLPGLPDIPIIGRFFAREEQDDEAED